jgi:hypothetical protein
MVKTGRVEKVELYFFLKSFIREHKIIGLEQVP